MTGQIAESKCWIWGPQAGLQWPEAQRKRDSDWVMGMKNLMQSWELSEGSVINEQSENFEGMKRTGHDQLN